MLLHKFSNLSIKSVLVASCLMLGSCSLVNPYAVWDRPSVEQVAQNKDITLAYAIAYAQNAGNAYQDKLSDHAILFNTVNPALTTLVGIVLALAAYDAHTDKILGVGLAGGTGYLIADQFSNRPQELVYLGGMEAMSCTVRAVSSLHFSTTSKDAFNNDLKALNTQITAVNAAIGTVNQLVVRPAGKVAEARILVKNAEGLLATSNQVYAQGHNVYRGIDTLGIRLVAAVDRIKVIVNKALHQSQPRLEQLTSIVSQLASAAGGLTPGYSFESALSGILTLTEKPLGPQTLEKVPDDSTEIKKQKKEREEAEERERALNTLASVTAALDSLTRRVSTTINSINIIQTQNSLEDCGVNVEKIPTAIVAKPTTIRASSIVASEHKIILSGGKSPYVANWLNNPTTGVTFTNPFRGGHVVVIKVNAGAPSGAYTLYIQDALERDVNDEANGTTTVEVVIGVVDE